MVRLNAIIHRNYHENEPPYVARVVEIDQCAVDYSQEKAMECLGSMVSGLVDDLKKNANILLVGDSTDKIAHEGMAFVLGNDVKVFNQYKCPEDENILIDFYDLSNTDFNPSEHE